jgi:hypothetical protein
MAIMPRRNSHSQRGRWAPCPAGEAPARLPELAGNDRKNRNCKKSGGLLRTSLWTVLVAARGD